MYRRKFKMEKMKIEQQQLAIIYESFLIHINAIHKFHLDYVSV